MAKLATNTRRSEHYGQLQRVVDSVFADGGKFVRRLDVVVAAESFDLPDDLNEIIALLPPGTYTRQRLCDQLNSAIGGCTVPWNNGSCGAASRFGRGPAV